MRAEALHIKGDLVAAIPLSSETARFRNLFYATKKATVNRLQGFHASHLADGSLIAFIEGNFSNLNYTPLTELPSPVLAEANRYKTYKKSIEYAIRVHSEQKYSTLKLPYVYHLMQTDKVVDAFFHEMPANKVMDVKIVALLHDTLEDTPATAAEITDLFGEEVLKTVERVTKVNEENTVDYETRYYSQVAESPLSAFVKIADKCANTKQTVKYFSSWHAKRIIEGHDLFKSLVYDKIEAPMLKNYLDNLILKLRKMDERL